MPPYSTVVPRPARSGPPLVLVVDDDADSRMICAKVLEGAGYRTATATSGDEALAQVERLKPDLILLDLMMPGMDGFTAAHLIHSRVETTHIPIVILTAAPTQREQAAYRVGAQAFCTKPIDGARLLGQVRRLCPTAVAGPYAPGRAGGRR